MAALASTIAAGTRLPACLGNCEHSDEMYGKNPAEYDGSKCGCSQCPNFEFCNVWSSPWYFGCHSGRCANCNTNFAKDLVFRPPAPDEMCPICMDTCTVMVNHPAECGHATCKECFVLQWQHPGEADWHVPEEFGFEATCCTDSGDCTAAACKCYEELEAWTKTRAGRAYSAANDLREAEWEAAREDVADPASCPVCRAHVKDAPSNSWKMKQFD
jgi:hypothetical protein